MTRASDRDTFEAALDTFQTAITTYIAAAATFRSTQPNDILEVHSKASENYLGVISAGLDFMFDQSSDK